MSESRLQDIAYVLTGDRAVLLNLARLDQPPVILDGSARVIWETLREAPDRAAAAKELADLHGVAFDRMLADVESAADHLASLGLL